MTPAEHAEEECTRFKDFRPTQFDSKAIDIASSDSGLDNKGEWFVLPCSRTRDSGILSESNFEGCLKELEEKEIRHEVHRFGHWGPGWYEIIIVQHSPSGTQFVGEVMCALADYPILYEDDYFERELELEYECWTNHGMSDMLKELVISDRAKELLSEFPDQCYELVCSVDDGRGLIECHDTEVHFDIKEIVLELSNKELAKLLWECRRLKNGPTSGT